MGQLLHVKLLCGTVDFSCIILDNREVRGFQFILSAIKPKSKTQD